jgi:pimeloyl-ACP methyl ester carboxylesterase
MRAGAVLIAIVVALGAAGGAQAASKKHGVRVHWHSVCFTVTNPAGGASTLYGKRYTYRRVTRRTPAIVLVHGIASSTANWDFSPSWSVARGLAKRGYVVYSYDRLGYARSGYFSQPGGGYTLTTSAHRRQLHDVVGEVKSGRYSTASAADCSGAKRPGKVRSNRVVVIGHSAGGWIVAGYPGEYHDVAAMVQADISGSANAPGNSEGGSFTPDLQHPDYFRFFDSSDDCRSFNVYPPGAVQRVVDTACAPPFLLSPFGEIQDLAVKYAENDAAIKMIGPKTPVLLTAGDHDTTDPPDTAAADYSYYKANCGCPVKALQLKDTGHLFMAHRSLRTWNNAVTAWLRHRGIAAPKPKRRR